MKRLMLTAAIAFCVTGCVAALGLVFIDAASSSDAGDRPFLRFRMTGGAELQVTARHTAIISREKRRTRAEMDAIMAAPDAPPMVYSNYRDTLARLPHGVAAFVFALPPALLLLRRAFGPPPSHVTLCPSCGYDLRATPDRCPECGAVPAERG